jgi:NADH:ubiquinone oxidoreductase subunit 3 (subunit A)
MDEARAKFSCQFTLASLFVVVTLLAVVIGLWRIHPVLLVLLLPGALVAEVFLVALAVAVARYVWRSASRRRDRS